METLTKLRILWGFLVCSFDSWREEVWRRDLDELYCCNGHECGCYGATVREMHGPRPLDKYPEPIDSGCDW